MATNTTTASAGVNRPVLLPEKGTARVKNVLSGDTVILWGRAQAPGLAPPQVQFTLEGLMAPRLASKNYPNEDPGAFPAREFLREMLVGKTVSFHTIRRKPQTSGAGGDSTLYYHYGHLYFNNENVAIKVVENGHAQVKNDIMSMNEKDDKDGEADPGANEYRKEVTFALAKAKEGAIGIHGPAPSVRSLKDLQEKSLNDFIKKMTNKKVKCVIEYIFDGSRYRCQVTDTSLPDQYLNASFTLLLAGVVCPRCARMNDASSKSEPLGDKARLFVEERLLQRQLEMSFHGTDKNSMGAVVTVHHPKGNIAMELLKNGLARMADWSVRMMKPVDIPPLRSAENLAKKTNKGVWHSYVPPKLSGAAEIQGICLEVQSGDTIMVLPSGKDYTSEDVLEKVSLASIRAPRVGNERVGRADEPYAVECKEKLRSLLVAKAVRIRIHYERDIPLGPENTELRRFGTVAVGKRYDVGNVLLSEGLAVTQRHRDDDEKSPNYDDLLIAESKAKEAKKGIHADGEYKKGNINDLTEPRKAKGYSEALIRGGPLKAIVDYVFNGARFKLYIPSENCYIMFAPNALRCPQPSPSPGARSAGKKAEPFGDASKRHARTKVLQRNVEINCSGVTMGGVMTGSLHIGQGSQRRDYSLELVALGLASLDQRKIDYGEAPKHLVDAQMSAKSKKLGIWSIERVQTEKPAENSKKTKVKEAKIRLSEIRSGSHFFYHLVDDESAKVMEDSMKLFTENNGTDGAPCDVKVGKIVAALFDDGTGKSWYRAKIVEKKGTANVSVLFIDHGNVATIPLATHLRPLDDNLDVEKIPAVAKEASLALTITRSLQTDEGIDAARMLQQLAWGEEVTARLLGKNPEGQESVILMSSNGSDTPINEQLISAGLARVAKPRQVDSLKYALADPKTVMDFAGSLKAAQETARKSRAGMWRYGDVGDDDEDDK